MSGKAYSFIIRLTALLLCVLSPFSFTTTQQLPVADLVPAPPLPTLEHLVPALCEHVVDGDTAWFQVIENGIEVTHKVRFLGIDTPETVHPNLPEQPGGREASDYVKGVLDGQAVWLEYDVERTDHYGRQLCFIWLEDGTLLNLQLVALGYARVLYIEPNRRYFKFFVAAEEAAKAAELGLWDPDI